MALDLVDVLRWIHVLAAIVAVGFGAFMTFMVSPAMLRLAPPQRGTLVVNVMRPGAAWAVIALDVLVLTGIGLGERLYWSRGDWVTSDPGKGVLTGLMVAVVMLVNAHYFMLPAVKRMAKAASAGGPPAAADLAIARTVSPIQLGLGFSVLLIMVAAGHGGLPWGGILAVLLVTTGLVVAVSGLRAKRAMAEGAAAAAPTPPR